MYKRQGFQRAFQLLGLLVGGPTGDIAEGIIRGFNTVPLADGIGDAFCLDLLSAPVFLVLGDVYKRQVLALATH